MHLRRPRGKSAAPPSHRFTLFQIQNWIRRVLGAKRRKTFTFASVDNLHAQKISVKSYGLRHVRNPKGDRGNLLHHRRHIGEHTITARPAANLTPPCEDSTAASSQTEYHLGLWQDQPPSPRYIADAAIPIGEGSFARAPVVPTEFELQVRHLRLARETYVYSAELRRWCEENRNRFYIPEWLLDEWHINVDPNVGGAA
jgi:hypothetical protein